MVAADAEGLHAAGLRVGVGAVEGDGGEDGHRDRHCRQHRPPDPALKHLRHDPALSFSSASHGAFGFFQLLCGHVYAFLCYSGHLIGLAVIGLPVSDQTLDSPKVIGKMAASAPPACWKTLALSLMGIFRPVSSPVGQRR